MEEFINHEEAYLLAIMKKENSNLARCYLDLKEKYFLIQGIVNASKQVLEKQNPEPLMVDRGLPFEEWKLYVAIEEYEKLFNE